ncbi:MAG TPA: hypothetical protein VEC15_06450 [Actinomycetota bacterium]|nr:hypothetical protein [Actinomycetota bacterium]
MSSAATTDGPGDPFAEALELVEAAAANEIPLRLVGGFAVRVLTPRFPPRIRDGQDIDLASTSAWRVALTELFETRGYEPDRHFNALYGHKQLYFGSPTGRAVDVIIDTLEMCHTLPFAERISRLPLTLDASDVLLSKLQIVELNEKDVQDIVYLLGAIPVETGDRPGTVGLERIGELVQGDWGWWRTVSMNLERVRTLVSAERPDVVPSDAQLDVLAQIDRLLAWIDSVPKTRRWRLRSRIGDRKRWYRLPDETAHG